MMQLKQQIIYIQKNMNPQQEQYEDHFKELINLNFYQELSEALRLKKILKR